MSDIPVYIRTLPNPDLTFHRPQHVYEATDQCPIFASPAERVICQLTSNTNESGIWCEECGERNLWTRLLKSFQSQGTNFARVWHDTDTPNLATGQVESDPRKFREHLHVASEQMAERLNMPVDYQPCDMTDKDALGVTDEGMDATHNQAVKDGRRDSRGRFVW